MSNHWAPWRHLITALLLCFALPALSDRPALMLANRYHDNIQLEDYWVSEKLDGVRAYWNGHQLISRGGMTLQAPAWFVEGFPPQPLDGELWMGRGRFEAVAGAVRRLTPERAQWQQIRFMVFDLPAHPGNFNQRLAALQRLLTHHPSPYLALVEQQKFPDQHALMRHLDRVVAGGGEGLMLHWGKASYRPTRSDDLLKLKRYQDGEATVIAHLPGKGKYRGMMGALLVELPNGKRFKIGSGFSDRQRAAPPPPGSLITFKYYGLTDRGIPRFASFLRQRQDL